MNEKLRKDYKDIILDIADSLTRRMRSMPEDKQTAAAEVANDLIRLYAQPRALSATNMLESIRDICRSKADCADCEYFIPENEEDGLKTCMFYENNPDEWRIERL